MHLSKTSFLQYIQCNKLFWVIAHAPAQIPWLPRQLDKLRQQEGRKVEQYAQRIFLDGARIDRNIPFEEIIAQSQVAVSSPIFNKPIFNPIIQSKDLIAEIDILFPQDDGTFDLFEVKSSTDIKDHYLPQVAFQRHVCTQAGLKIQHAYLLTINNSYIRQGKINPHKLFNKNDITEGVDKIAQEIMHQISMAKEIIAQDKCPEIEIGAHCDCPYECPMKEVCWKKVNDCPNNICTLTRLIQKDAWALYNQGIIESKDIPANYKLMPRQRLQIECEKTGKMRVNKKGVREFLDGLVYPLYFLDFETINPTVPWLEGMTPYQQLPFQFSLHRMDSSKAEPWHDEWIWGGGGDDNGLDMLMRLEGFMGKKGSIVAYNAAFEKNVLKAAIKMHLEYGVWLEGILPRFVDLWVPFRNYVVYHPGQHGSASLKAVLPSLTGESYANLEIQCGEMAGWMFRRLMESKDEEEIEGIKDELKKYCGLDTWGMVLILRRLVALSQ